MDNSKLIERIAKRYEKTMYRLAGRCFYCKQPWKGTLDVGECVITVCCGKVVEDRPSQRPS